MAKIDEFTSEKRCVYKDRIYFVRDNLIKGKVFTRTQYGDDGVGSRSAGHGVII